MSFSFTTKFTCSCTVFSFSIKKNGDLELKKSYNGVSLSKGIGLSINLQKCLVIGGTPVKILHGESSIPFVNYSKECIRFLGNYIGNDEEIKNRLAEKNLSIHCKLKEVLDLGVGKQISFAVLQACFAGKITHYLRGLPPNVTCDFSRDFNKIRTKLLSVLIDCGDTSLPGHCFTSTCFGGVGFSKAKYLREGAFLGCLKNFLFEFRIRYPDLWLDHRFLSSSPCSWLTSLHDQIENLDADIWASLFPISVTEIPQRSLFSLPLCVRKLQKQFINYHESLDFNNRISLAKIESPAFCAFLKDISSDEASTLITRYPQRYSFNLKDHEWLINIRLRLGLWPVGLLQKSTCVCGSSLASFHHVVNCHKFIHLRSIIHNSLRDQCLELFKSNGFHGKIETVLNTLSDSIMRDKSRGDLIGTWLSSQEIIMDFATVDPCNSTSVNKILDENYSALETAERKKLDRYGELISKMNSR
ncbi:hypothetical protein GEMRC1_001385 [Eukaryota sp. GEM-RC1]